MIKNTIEKQYPISFRNEDAKLLGKQLKNGHSVELVAMKRAGISNFLRFFINHEGIKEKYINTKEEIIFVEIDLNDLIERELFPFWRLTFKRLVDLVEKSDFDDQTKKRASTLFLNTIQTGDLFLTIDGFKELINIIISKNKKLVFLFVGFDRLKDVVTPEFLNNLIGISSTSFDKVCYVFTSYRNLNQIAPEVFEKTELNAFSHEMYVKPAKTEDMQIIFNTLAQQYDLQLSQSLRDSLIDFSGGHVQYLQLSLIIINEIFEESKKVSDEDIIQKIKTDERIELQSEELFTHLNEIEQQTLTDVVLNQNISADIVRKAAYLWNTGMVVKKGKKNVIFSEYLKLYVEGISTQSSQAVNDETHLTKKEYLLYTLLESNKNEISEREKIVEVVWPEYSQYGVSDWSIDRLVSRLRKKLELQGSDYKIETIRTRGFRLIGK